MTEAGDISAPTIHVVPRVHFDAGATVTLESDGEPPETIELRTVSRLFAIGVTMPEGEPADPSTASRLVLTGTARFMVGTVDVGRRRGMRAVGRGLEAALEAGLWHVRHEAPSASQEAEEAPAVQHHILWDHDSDHHRQIVVTEGELAESFDEMLERAIEGVDVIITRDGTAVAALVGWGWYARQRERLARLSAAYWSAWRTGRFDLEAYGGEVIDLSSSVGPEGQVSTEAEKAHVEAD